MPVDELSWNGLVTVESRIDRAIVGTLRGRDLSGFEIWRWLGSESGTSSLLIEPALYPTLYRLESERLLRSDWHEGERTRRTYRLTATALQLAEENRWPALPFRGGPISHAEPAHGARIASPDPEAGSWFVPPRSELGEAAVLPAAETERVWGSPATPPGRGEPIHMAHGGSASRFPAIARYVDDLGAALDLPRVDAERVRQEIADHLADSTYLLEQSGLDAATANAEAIGRLGSAQELAARISRAQQSSERRDRAVRRGIFELVGELVLWLAASAVPLVVAPGLTSMATEAARLAGLHLVVLTSAEWATNQIAIMLCIGAFAAGRLSFGHMARISRHSDAAIRRPWAIGGAAAVLAVALLLPGYQDGLVVATTLAAPLAFIAGTYWPKHQNESAYTWRGIATAIVLVAVITLLPAFRLFAYNPNATPGAAPAGGSAPAVLTVYEYPDGTFGYQLPGSSEFVSVDVWPASTDGLYVIVDRSATNPTLSGVRMLDLAKLPPGGRWWVAAVVVGPDGRRTVHAVVIQTGASPNLGNALNWLISRR